MKYLTESAGVVIVALFVGCSANVPTNILDGTQSKSVISIQFQDFPEGTVCQAETPDGAVSSPAFPGRIEYPAAFRESPVTCITPDNQTYDILLGSVLSDVDFRLAGVTAYFGGLLLSTISANDLLQIKNEKGVVKR